MLISPFINQPNDIDNIFKPISQENIHFKNDEYVERVPLDIYSLPVKFDMLSIAISHIDKYKKLPATEWEYSGYKYPETSTFDNALSFLATIPESYLYNLNNDELEPTPYGTLIFNFYNNDNSISIEIGKSKLGYYTSFVNLPNTSSEGIDFDAEKLPKSIMAAFEKLFS